MNKSLKELLDTEFTANEEGILVGSFTLDRINEIAETIIMLQNEVDRLTAILKEHNIPYEEK
jgi:uncharacterized small protein (DUF1192 family)